MMLHKIFVDVMRLNWNDNSFKRNVMTKNIIKIIFSLILAVVVACTDNNSDATIGFFLGEYESKALELSAVGGKETILVETNERWIATTNVPWITISPANGIGTVACEVIVDSTLVNEKRDAQIRFKPSVSSEKIVAVKQYGFEKIIDPKEKVIEIESSANKDKRFFEAEITSNIKFNIVFDYITDEENPDATVETVEWLSCDKKQVEEGETARPRSVKLRFDWRMNTVPKERKANIKFIPVNEGDVLETPSVISVIQKPAVKIEDNRAGDSIALVVINERLNCWSGAWDTSENMQYWPGVKLWEKTDTALPCPEAVGRVRSVAYAYIDTEETLPSEIKHLKYLESFSVSTNINTMLLNIDLGPEICSLQYLKHLQLFSYGFVSLPEDFKNLKNLVSLDLSANNFAEIPAVLTPENFPNLKSLDFVGNRRWTIKDLRDRDRYDDGIGLYFNTGTDSTLHRLLLWENLEELALSNCYMEGTIPDFVVGEDGVEAYTQADVDAWGGDTIQYLADNNIPKILPNCTSLKLNLNFFTGKLPDWLRYHPHLLEWIPEILIFNQYEKGVNSAGDPVGFDNIEPTFDYYYDVFPGMREKYELKEEMENE